MTEIVHEPQAVPARPPRAGDVAPGRNQRKPMGRRAALASETGGVLILGIGLTFVVMLFVAVAVALTSLYVQQRQLEDLADGAATYAAQQVSFQANVENCMFGVCSTGLATTLSSPQAAEHASAYLRRVAPHTGGTLSNVYLLPGTSVGRTQGGAIKVQLSLAGRANPPLVGWLTQNFGGGIAVKAPSRAGLFEQ